MTDYLVIPDREPFMCKVGTAKWPRLEKDLPPKEYGIK